MIELLRTEEMAQADRLAIAGGIAGSELMEKAGGAVASAAARLVGDTGRVVVVVGPGNNGGDGYVAARLLAERGIAVRILHVGPMPMAGDAAEAARHWQGVVEAATPDGIEDCDLIIDAIFGAGLARPVGGPAASVIAAINDAGVPVLAVDLPSGIDGNSGEVLGVAVRAVETVTFFRRKPAHLLLPGRTYCGLVRVTDIGIPATVLDVIRPQIKANEPALWQERWPILRADGHKYDRGHVVVVSGGLTSTGAARLAARAALRVGAGLVTIASPREALAVNAAANLSIMVRPADDAPAIARLMEDPSINVVVLGPGGGVGAAMCEKVLGVLATPAAAVLDADAITSFADSPGLLIGVLKSRNATTILTPHYGEFTRLIKNLDIRIKLNSKLERGLIISRIFNAIFILKGADTVVAAARNDSSFDTTGVPDGHGGDVAIANNAPPWLATAGAGDVLAGIVAGLLAQGMPAFEAAAAAVWLHGEAANVFGPGLIAEDLPEVLPQVLRHHAQPYGP
jgi:hydroxyethylthiazole kinase-like uncharacterized protein yjeF